MTKTLEHKTVDVTITCHGHNILVHPHTAKAHDWMNTHAAETQAWGNAREWEVIAQHKIQRALETAGLTVESSYL